jgi:hypothetical protein
MQCNLYQQTLSAAEALRQEEESHDFEEFERALMACVPDDLADVEIPDSLPREGPLREAEDLEVPDVTRPVCDRCLVTGALETVFHGYDWHPAYNLMLYYEEGRFGCPQSNVMAVSWSMVFQSGSVADGEIDVPAFRMASDVFDHLAPALSDAEWQAARQLAEEAYAMHSATCARFEATLAQRLVR